MIKITDRSLYRKIQVVIEEAGKRKLSSPKELINSLVNKKGGNVCFTYYKVKPGEHKATPVQCDQKVFLRTVNFAIFLGLIDKGSGHLTKVGIKALDREQFSRVLKQRIKSVLSANGLPFEKLLEVIQEIFQDAKSGKIPSCEYIYARLHELYDEEFTIERKTFHVLLTLLSYTDGIAFCQKKIYLPSPLKK